EAHPEVLDAEGAALVHEGGQEGVVHVPARGLPVVDPVPTGHLLDLGRRPGEERPTREVRPVRLGIALEDGWRVALWIHRDRQKEARRREISPEGPLQAGQLGGKEWTGVDKGGVDEGHRHDFPAQLLEGESLAILGRQAHLWRRPNPGQAVMLSGGMAACGRKPTNHCQHNEYPNAPPVSSVHASSLPSRVLLARPAFPSPSFYSIPSSPSSAP